ncbi:hypothetical protein GC194_01675 [bacterium]|nr:hypothetical protein [bacterium]
MDNVFVNKEMGLVVAKLEGNVVYADLENLIASIWQQPYYNKQFNIIFNLRYAKLHLQPQEMTALAGFILKSESASDGRGVVVINDELSTALTMLVEADLSHKNEMDVAWTVKEACDFLEVPYHSIPEDFR